MLICAHCVLCCAVCTHSTTHCRPRRVRSHQKTIQDILKNSSYVSWRRARSSFFSSSSYFSPFVFFIQIKIYFSQGWGTVVGSNGIIVAGLRLVRLWLPLWLWLCMHFTPRHLCSPHTHSHVNHTAHMRTSLYSIASFTLSLHRYAYNIIIFMTYHSSVCLRALMEREREGRRRGKKRVKEKQWMCGSSASTHQRRPKCTNKNMLWQKAESEKGIPNAIVGCRECPSIQHRR